MMRYMKLIAFGTGLLLAAGPLTAQDEQNADEPRQPKPSELMPLADEVIVNDVERRGDGFVAVGERGHILLSEDGQEWRQVKAPSRAMLTRVTFVDAQNGWAVGHDGVVLRSTDGGETWQLKHFDSSWGKPFYDVLFQTPEVGLVTGANGRMMTTSDGGETWNTVENDVFGTGYHHYMIDRTADGTLLIAGERGFLGRSTDGGDTWEMLEPPYIGSYFGVLPHGEHGAVLFGLQGRVFYAADVRELPTLDDPYAYNPFSAENITDPERLAEMGWREIENPSGESLFGGNFYSGDKLIFVGVDGTIVHGTLDSERLSRTDSPTAEPISDVIVRDNGLLLTGRTGIYHGEKP